MSREGIGHFELTVLLAVLRIGDEAYGVSIARELEDATGHAVLLASVYAALGRLESKRLVRSTLGDATAERGGRAKKYFSVTAKGLRQIKEAQRSLVALWSRIPALRGGTA